MAAAVGASQAAAKGDPLSVGRPGGIAIVEYAVFAEQKGVGRAVEAPQVKADANGKIVAVFCMVFVVFTVEDDGAAVLDEQLVAERMPGGGCAGIAGKGEKKAMCALV